jgi:hypothetical protein
MNIATRLEDYEVMPLLQVVRAALSSPERSPDKATHEGIILLIDIIEERMLILIDPCRCDAPPPPPQPVA